MAYLWWKVWKLKASEYGARLHLQRAEEEKSGMPILFPLLGSWQPHSPFLKPYSPSPKILLNYPVHSIIHTFLLVRSRWDQPLLRAGLSHVCLSRNLSHCSLVPLKQGLDANSTSVTMWMTLRQFA